MKGAVLSLKGYINLIYAALKQFLLNFQEHQHAEIQGTVTLNDVVALGYHLCC